MKVWPADRFEARAASIFAILMGRQGQSQTRVGQQTKSIGGKMNNSKTGGFQVKSWKEQTDEEPGKLKLTRVRATMAYQGVIEGEGVVDFLMYSPDGRVTSFVGLELITGSIAGRSGTVVFQHNGTFADGVAKSKWSVIPNSGTEALRGLRGQGSYGDNEADVEHGGQAPYSFTFDFA